MRLTRALAVVTLVRKQIEQRSTTPRPFRAVLAGPPNAGKSSLFNALLGRDAALVSDQPGTTRDFLCGRLVIEHLTIELVDTAGLRPLAQTNLPRLKSSKPPSSWASSRPAKPTWSCGARKRGSAIRDSLLERNGPACGDQGRPCISCKKRHK